MAENKLPAQYGIPYPKPIPVEFLPNELEVLIGAIANFVPADRSHEMILIMLYTRLKRKLEESNA